MRYLKGFRNWGDTHHPKFFDIIRILIGLLLISKGYMYLNNAGYIRELVITHETIKGSPEFILAIIYYATYVQLVCGILITLGLATRIAALLTLPLLFGAVFFVNNIPPYISSELWLSIFVMVMLAIFVVIGSGPWSLDRLLRRP